MSLRGKILSLFLFLAIAPLLAVAGSAYVQSQRAVEDLMEGRIVAAASYAAEDLGRSFRRIDAQLRQLASDPAFQRVLASPAGTPQRAAAVDAAEKRLAELWPYLGPEIVSLSFHGSEGESLRGDNPRTEHRSPCEAGAETGLISVTRAIRSDLGEELGTVSTALSARSLVRPDILGAQFARRGTLGILDLTTGRTVNMVSCDPLDAATLLAETRGLDGRPLSLARSGTRFTYLADGEERVGAFIPLPSPPWTVVVTGSTADFVGPLRELQNGYALFVALVALSTALAFSLSINQAMRSLEDLGDAADKIGRGELDPWLPPPSQDEVGRLSFAIGRMAERIRHMVRQVDRSSRMAVVGELASYLAHEIRNPLSSIKLNLQSLSRELEGSGPDSDVTHEIRVCLKEVGRLERVVSSVLKLGNARPAQVETGSIHDLLEETVELLRPELDRYGVTAQLSLDASEVTITADFAQLKGVFMNLLLNAADAMPEGGTVHVRTENSGNSEPVVIVHVADEGSGVAPELRERIFEPFFTTKAAGSGIGLSLAARAVEDHRGRIYLLPSQGVDDGARFAVELPVVRNGARGRPETPVDPPPTPSREAGLPHPPARTRPPGRPSARSDDGPEPKKVPEGTKDT